MVNATDFCSPKELAELLEAVGLRLHSQNRIAGGESGFVWHLAETIRGAGRLAAQFDEEPTDLRALFGDGYDDGSTPKAAQQDRFLDLLRGKMMR